jgi:hypothetical protein
MHSGPVVDIVRRVELLRPDNTYTGSGSATTKPRQPDTGRVSNFHVPPDADNSIPPDIRKSSRKLYWLLVLITAS